MDGNRRETGPIPHPSRYQVVGWEAGKGDRLLDNFLEKVSKSAESEGISEEAV